MSGCALTVCRGCCCGTDDPVAARDRIDWLRSELPGIRVGTSDCLGPCERRDVVVVRPAASFRRSGSRPVWLGYMAATDSLASLASWLREGGPGAAPIPGILGLCQFRPTRRSQRAG